MSVADEFLPIYQFSERHEIEIQAPTRFILEAVDGFRHDDDQLIRALIALPKPNGAKPRLALCSQSAA
jgi:hypothetical protein